MPKKAKAKPKAKKKDIHENCIHIDGLPAVSKKVRELMEEKTDNPGTVQDEEAGLVFIEGEPNMVLDNKYVPHEEAMIIFKTRKVVQTYLELQDLINKQKKQ